MNSVIVGLQTSAIHNPIFVFVLVVMSVACAISSLVGAVCYMRGVKKGKRLLPEEQAEYRRLITKYMELVQETNNLKAKVKMARTSLA